MARPEANNVVLDYTIAHGNGIIDVARGLSLLNRKSYRSGYCYSVDFVEYIGHTLDTIRTGCLPMSYPMFNAYQMGFEAWREQRAMVLDEAESLEPGRWADFKPFFSLGHLLGGGAGGFIEYLPFGIIDYSLNLGPLDDTDAEWSRATLEYNDPGAATTSEVYVGMLGADALGSQYGSLMYQYGSLRSPTLAPDPNTPQIASGAWITRTGEQSQEMSEAVVNSIENDNDFPPYANQTDPTLPPTYVGNDQSAPGGLLMDQSVTGTTGRAVSLSGGILPCGFLIFNADMDDQGNVATLRVHCTRGSYKGVAALSMGDFK